MATAAGVRDDCNDATGGHEAPSQLLVELPREDSAPFSLGAADGDQYYDDGIADLPPEAASESGRTAWLWILGFFILLSASFTLGALAAKNSTRPLPVGPLTESSDAAAGGLVVHVTGRVKSPGLYNLPFQARVNDAITKAGGPLPDADLNAINLAAWAQDGSRIEVPSKAVAPRLTQAPEPVAEPLPEVAPSIPEPAPAAKAPAPAVARHAARAKPAPAPLPKKAPKTKKDEVPRAVTASGAESANASPEFLEKNPIDLNTATAEQLQMLPGVGPAMAAKILAYRQENQRFNSVDDLDNIRGIGAKTLEKLRPLVTVK